MSELDGVEEESQRLFEAMSEREVESAKAELMAALDPSVVAMFRKMGERKQERGNEKERKEDMKEKEKKHDGREGDKNLMEEVMSQGKKSEEDDHPSLSPLYPSTSSPSPYSGPYPHPPSIPITNESIMKAMREREELEWTRDAGEEGGDEEERVSEVVSERIGKYRFISFDSSLFPPPLRTSFLLPFPLSPFLPPPSLPPSLPSISLPSQSLLLPPLTYQL